MSELKYRLLFLIVRSKPLIEMPTKYTGPSKKVTLFEAFVRTRVKGNYDWVNDITRIWTFTKRAIQLFRPRKRYCTLNNRLKCFVTAIPYHLPFSCRSVSRLCTLSFPGTTFSNCNTSSRMCNIVRHYLTIPVLAVNHSTESS